MAIAVGLATVSFGLGQPALTALVGGAVHADVRGVALGIATRFFLVGGSVGSAVVAGLGEVIGIPASLAALAVLPALGLVARSRTCEAGLTAATPGWGTRTAAGRASAPDLVSHG